MYVLFMILRIYLLHSTPVLILHIFTVPCNKLLSVISIALTESKSCLYLLDLASLLALFYFCSNSVVSIAPTEILSDYIVTRAKD